MAEASVAALVLDAGEQAVPAASILDPTWLAAQIDLRGQRWQTDDRRVLANLWWYSASVWTIGPTIASLVAGEDVLSAEPGDLQLHWLPDSRITGATSTRVIEVTEGIDRIDAAGATLRRLYASVIPRIAEAGSMRERPLWAIAADALAGRLLWAGQAIGDVERAADLLRPLSDIVGAPLPLTGYAREGSTPSRVDRCSCCLLYLAPRQSTCSDCPRSRSSLGYASRRAK